MKGAAKKAETLAPTVGSLLSQNLDLINALLKTTDAMGAYSLGLVSCLAARDRVRAPDSLLEAAASCRTVAEAVELYKSRPASGASPAVAGRRRQTKKKSR